MTIRMIPVASLDISERNVRKTNSSHDLERLKADIAAHGVLQNLVAIPTPGKRKGRYEVTAGGRRLAAARMLIADGTWAEDAAVPVLVLDAEAGAEASLSENFQRANVNPADECVAFRELIESGGHDIATIAKRFGLTTRFVEGRLRLADLAEPVFEALRDGTISLEVAQGFGRTADRTRQAQIWEKLRQQPWMLTPERVKNAMQQDTIRGDSPIARFVGEDAYRAAGGQIDADLFGDEEHSIWRDTALAMRLGEEKLREIAIEVRETEGFREVLPALSGISRPPHMVPVYGTLAPMTDAERARVAEIEDDCEAFEQAWADADEVPPEVDERWEALLCEKEAILDRPMVYTPEQKARATAFLVLDRNGVPQLWHSIFEERAAAEEATTATTGSSAGGRTDAEDETDTEPPEIPTRTADSRVSQALLDDLTNNRAAIVQLALAQQPDLALQVLAYSLAVDATESWAPAAFEVRGREQWAGGRSEPDTAIDAELVALRGRLQNEWMAEKGEIARFEAFRAMTADEMAAWLAWCLARTIVRTWPGAVPLVEHLAQMLQVEPHKVWRPTASNYFGRVPKNVTMQALEEVGGPDLRNRYASLKKKELAEAAERVFAGKTIVEPHVQVAAVHWVPPQLRFDPSPAADGPDDEGAHEDGDGGDTDEASDDDAGDDGPDSETTPTD